MQKAAFIRCLALTVLMMLAAFAASPAAFADVVGRVQGTVRGENGQPLPNVRVSLIGAGTPPQSRTDKSGNYLFAGVPPGAYTLRAQLISYDISESPVQVVQDITSTIDFTLSKSVIQKGGNVFVTRVRRADTSNTTAISKVDEQREKSQPNNLYQSTGLLNYKPGITVDSGQYPHLRGSAQNQIDYLVDGISVRDPIFNEFQTNLVTVGIQTSNVQTAGEDASYGGATGGYLNQISSNGRDLKGGTIESTFGPAHLWRYAGNRFEYGNITPDRKFDYAISNINFRTYYGANTQLGKLNSSTDSQIKLNYYGGNNTVTVYGSHGAEDYWTYDATNPNFDKGVGIANGEVNKFGFRNTVKGTDVNGNPITYSTALPTSDYQIDHSLQTNNNFYTQVRHSFKPSEYVQYRFFNLHQNTPAHSENTGAGFSNYYASKKGNQLDYYNELSHALTLRAGYLNIDGGGTAYNVITDRLNGVLTPISAANPYYYNRIYDVRPLENDAYLSGTFKTPDNKLTTDIGVRYGQSTYRGSHSAAGDALYAALFQDVPSKQYTTHYVDPRLGLNFSPDRNTVLRTSFSVNSQMPETRYVGASAPLEDNQPNTGIDPVSQFNYLHARRINMNHLGPYHSNDFDIGVEKAITVKGLLNGAYSTSLTGYKKKQYDIIEEDQPSFDLANNGTFVTTVSGQKIRTTRASYDNGGHGHSSGVEFTFRKAQVHHSDWSGYFNYTNQVVRNNTDFGDTGYAPRFYLAVAGNPDFYDSRTPGGNPNPLGLPASQDLRHLNQLEFPASYDQRHTIGAVLNKSFFKYIDSSFVLDAGSGYPFYPGAAAGDGALGTVDANYGELGRTLSPGGSVDFTEVPFVAGVTGGTHANPIGVVAGRSSWHYKVAVNTTFHVTSQTSLFLNVDNIFDKKTITNYGPATFSGQPYFVAPTAAYPQGRIVYGSQTVLTPIFLTFGFQQKF